MESGSEGPWICYPSHTDERGSQRFASLPLSPAPSENLTFYYVLFSFQSVITAAVFTWKRWPISGLVIPQGSCCDTEFWISGSNRRCRLMFTRLTSGSVAMPACRLTNVSDVGPTTSRHCANCSLSVWPALFAD